MKFIGVRHRVGCASNRASGIGQRDEERTLLGNIFTHLLSN
jgi:hypothetical protein